MSDIFEEARERHIKNVSDFGIPDRFIDGNEEKVWRIRGLLYEEVDRSSRLSWPPLVPVYRSWNNKETIGMATLYPVHGNQLEATATLAYSIPERLDFENGQAFELIAVSDYPPRWAAPEGKAPRRTHITSLVMSRLHEEDNLYAIVSDDGVI